MGGRATRQCWRMGVGGGESCLHEISPPPRLRRPFAGHAFAQTSRWLDRYTIKSPSHHYVNNVVSNRQGGASEGGTALGILFCVFVCFFFRAFASGGTALRRGGWRCVLGLRHRRSDPIVIR